MRNIDQERAAYAWGCVQAIDKSYTNLAKGAPALIMTSGLLQTLAFYQGKGEKHHKALVGHICTHLHDRFKKEIANADFKTVMESLYGSSPRFYQLATEETLELLRWLRQFAAAVKGDH
jgi:CRISPR-associated protein Cmr5